MLHNEVQHYSIVHAMFHSSPTRTMVLYSSIDEEKVDRQTGIINATSPSLETLINSIFTLIYPGAFFNRFDIQMEDAKICPTLHQLSESFHTTLQ